MPHGNAARFGGAKDTVDVAHEFLMAVIDDVVGRHNYLLLRHTADELVGNLDFISWYNLEL